MMRPSVLIVDSVREKLKSGEITVSGDQWPVFLYAGNTYDPEDPWNRLLQSHILVCVSLFNFTTSALH